MSNFFFFESGPPRSSSCVHALDLVEANIIPSKPLSPFDPHKHVAKSAGSSELPTMTANLPDTDCDLDFYSTH